MSLKFGICSVAIVLSAISSVARQAAQPSPPATEIYLARLGVDTMPLTGGPLVNISNSAGYDNQPCFTPDGKALLFTSNRDGKQTDIYRYDIETGSLTQLTHTAESEYSPLVTPDGRTFSVVRVESDGTQRVWRFDLDGSNPRIVLERVKPVGYHAWIDATHLAVFVLGANDQPATLQLADTATGDAVTIEAGIGRSLQLHRGTGAVTFVGKPSGGHWLIKELNPQTRDVTTIAQTVDDNVSEDFVWHRNGTQLLMASGTKVFRWSPPAKVWNEVGDFTGSGVMKITRLAVSPFEPGIQPRLALVAEPGAK